MEIEVLDVYELNNENHKAPAQCDLETSALENRVNTCHQACIAQQLI